VREWSRHRWVLPVVALGGAVGASGRHAIDLLWPAQAGGFPWGTFAVNVSGCLLIGVLMVHVVEVGRTHPLVRPFLGVGVLGGYTTFSTYAVQATSLTTAERPALALGYLFGTLAAAMAAVVAGVFAARTLVGARHRWGRNRGGAR